jgi:hypothetical protein
LIHDGFGAGSFCWPVLRNELFVGPVEQSNFPPEGPDGNWKSL